MTEKKGPIVDWRVDEEGRLWPVYAEWPLFHSPPGWQKAPGFGDDLPEEPEPDFLKQYTNY